MYEHRTLTLLSRSDFTKRVAHHLILAFLLLALALGIGVVGYRYLGALKWLDALLNASMILGGMGAVDSLHKLVTKLFASCNAFFSGIAFIGVASVMVAPFAHRFLHRFHLDE